MSRFATGVAVITAQGERGPAGMTANALTSLSLDPLSLLVCFAQDARTLPAVRRSGRFAVNVLGAGQRDLAERFASKLAEDEKFAGVGHTLRSEVPVLDGAIAWLVCGLDRLVPGGDHEIAIGTVIEMGESEGEPLVFYAGGYGLPQS